MFYAQPASRGNQREARSLGSALSQQVGVEEGGRERQRHRHTRAYILASFSSGECLE